MKIAIGFRETKVTNLPLQALYYFYHAAELGSFKAAADLLNVTAGAMSQQIRLLEDRLDTQLFERQHRKVVLTAAGQRLLPYARQGFSQLREGLNQIGHDPDPTSLTLSTLSSFGQQWLVPRLGELKRIVPDLSIALMPTEKLVNFNRDPVDLCIRFGEGKYEGLKSEFIMHDYLYPVCHPLFLQQRSITCIEDLCQCDLLEDTQPDMSWDSWLAQAGVNMTLDKSSVQYAGVHFVVEGALAVQGVALVRHSVAWRYVQQGTLIKLFDTELRSRYSYYLCAPASHFKRRKVQAFARWLHETADEFVASTPFLSGAQ